MGWSCELVVMHIPEDGMGEEMDGLMISGRG
jgi:hypothetical protein